MKKLYHIILLIVIVSCYRSDFIPEDRKEDFPQALIGSWYSAIIDPIEGKIQRSEITFSEKEEIGSFVYSQFGYTGTGERIQIGGFKGEFEIDGNLLKLFLEKLYIHKSSDLEGLSTFNANHSEWESISNPLLLFFELNDYELLIFSDENGDGLISDTEHYIFSKTSDDLLISCI